MPRRQHQSTQATQVVNMHAAKTQLSRLVEAACAGEDIIIARNGEPAVRLVPVQSKRRVPGALKGVTLDDSFFEPLPDDVLKGFGY